MKKSFMTRVLATGLSVAMAFSLSTATNLVSAQAASKPVLVDYDTNGSGKTMTVNVGETAKIKVNKATKKNYKIASVKVSSNKIRAAKNKAGTVVTVRGLVATEENKPAAIKVSFTSKKTKKASKYTFASKVTVVGKAEEKPEVLGIKEVKQNKFTKFTATFSDKVTEIKAADLTIVRDLDNENIVIKSATVDSTDATKVTIETYKSLTDGATYTVTYTAADEAKTQTSAKITVTDGTVAAVNITPTEVSYNTRTTISYQTLDKDGVVISEFPVRAANKEAKVDVTFESAYGTLDDDTSKLILYNEGDTATFKVTYHTYKYSASGEEEGAVSDTFTVKAVSNANALASYTYTVTKPWDGEPYDWKAVTPVNFIAINDTTTEMGRNTAYFYITNTKGEYATKDLDYTVESSDNSVVIADGTVKDGATLEPVAVGEAYLNIKDSDGKVVKTLPISVKAKRVLSTVSLSTSTVTVVTGASNVLANMDSQSVKAKAKDQYGADYGNVNWEIKAVSDSKDNASFSATTGTGNEFKVAVGANQTAETDAYKITATDTVTNDTRAQLLNVKIVSGANQKGKVTKAVVFTQADGTKVTALDTKWDTNWANGASGLKATIVEMINGAVRRPVDFTQAANVISAPSIKITKANGTVWAKTGAPVVAPNMGVKTNGGLVDAALENVTSGAVTFDAMSIGRLGGNVAGAGIKYMDADSYTFTFDYFEMDGTKRVRVTPKATLKITDSDVKFTGVVNSTSTSSTSSMDTFFEDTDNFTIYCGNVKMDKTLRAGGGTGIYTIQAVEYTTNADGKTAFVKNVYANVEVEGSGKYIQVKIPVNKSIRSTAAWTN